MADKIRNVRTDRCLPTEACPIEPVCAKRRPDQSLGIGGVAAQFPCTAALCFRHMPLRLLCQLFAPSLSLPRLRGRENKGLISQLQRAIPIRSIDVDGADLNTMLLCVAHELCRRVETHRLAVEQSSHEHV